MKRAGICATAAALVLACVGPLQAHEVQYFATLTGPSVSPPNASPAVGSVLLTIDLDLVDMRVEGSFSGLLGTVTAAHIHGKTPTPLTGTAGVAVLDPSLPGFPLGVTAGSYDQTIDLTQASAYSPAFITASGGTISDALNGLLFGLEDGRMYFDIETTAFPGGEVRGFLTAVPEPASLGLSGAGFAMLMLRRRSR